MEQPRQDGVVIDGHRWSSYLVGHKSLIIPPEVDLELGLCIHFASCGSIMTKCQDYEVAVPTSAQQHFTFFDPHAACSIQDPQAPHWGISTPKNTNYRQVRAIQFKAHHVSKLSRSLSVLKAYRQVGTQDFICFFWTHQRASLFYS